MNEICLCQSMSFAVSSRLPTRSNSSEMKSTFKMDLRWVESIVHAVLAIAGGSL